MRSQNEVIMQGRITYARKTEQGRTVFVVEMHEGRERSNTVRWTYNGDLPDSIGRGSKVEVKGYVVAYSQRDRETGARRNVQYFIAETVARAKTAIEEEWNLRGNFYKPDYFVGKFAGEVVRTFNIREGWGNLVVLVDSDNLNRMASQITFSYRKTERFPDLEKYKEGDPVYLITSINTNKKTLDGQRVAFENMLIEDIAKGRKPLAEKAG